jgi:rubrerythrin
VDARTEKLARHAIRVARLVLTGEAQPEELGAALDAFEDGDGGWIEWRCGDCGELDASREELPKECPNCGAPRVEEHAHHQEPTPIAATARRVLRKLRDRAGEAA